MNGFSVIVIFICIMLVGCATTPTYQCNQEVETTPIARFERNFVDGTVFDKKTGLIWKICAEGQNYSGGHCTKQPISFTYNEAVKAVDGNEDRWRLPNKDELLSIVEKRCQNPAVNREVFTDFAALDYWSSSFEEQLSDVVFVVSYKFDSFAVGLNVSDHSHLRLVRGEQWVDPDREEMLRKKQLQQEDLLRQKQLNEQKKKALFQELAQAEKDAYFTCSDSVECEKAFALTQIFINSKSDQKIQIATDAIIETYNPSEIGSVGMNAIKMPGKGNSALIRLTVICKDDDSRISVGLGKFKTICAEKQLSIYNTYRLFIENNLTE